MSESIRAVSPLSVERNNLAPGRAAAGGPTVREWVRHAALFLLTALTTTTAGVLLAVDLGEVPEPAWAAPAWWFDYLLLVPAYYYHALAAVAAHAVANPILLMRGATFAAALLAILVAHEAGHYLACRYYGVNATLPFFIPAPPFFLAGTFGAFIRIRSPIPSRRALFDIGIAGPLAGFAVILPIALVAMLTAQSHASPLPTEGVIIFNDPPLLRLIAAAIGITDLSNVAPNSLYFAAWIGLLVTSLNLMPVGQLDGGHAIYALCGTRSHRRVGRVAFVVMATLAPLGLIWHGAPSGFVYALLLLIMLRVRHPQADDESDRLGRGRLLVALLTLAVFLLSFVPFPLTLT